MPKTSNMGQPYVINNPPNPYLGPIPHGFRLGSMIRIQGVVPRFAKRFSINLQWGPNAPRDDIALHNEFRFRQKFLVRNHLQGCTWGPMETLALPVQQGGAFEGIFKCETADIKMAFNGQQLPAFAHRMAYSRITHLNVEGDVKISSISYKVGPPPPPPPPPPAPGYQPIPFVPSGTMISMPRPSLPQSPSYCLPPTTSRSGRSYVPNTSKSTMTKKEEHRAAKTPYTSSLARPRLPSARKGSENELPRRISSLKMTSKDGVRRPSVLRFAEDDLVHEYD